MQVCLCPLIPNRSLRVTFKVNDLTGKIVDNIVVPQWKLVEVEERGKRKYTMKIVNKQMTKPESIDHLNI